MPSVCLLVLYEDTEAVLSADISLSKSEWRERVNAAARRFDEIDGGAATLAAELAAYKKGLRNLFCYMYPDTKMLEYIEMAPSIPGW